MTYSHRHLAWLALATAFNAYAAPRQVDVQETLAACTTPAVQFPAGAQKEHIEGRVVVYTAVDVHGNVSETRITRSSGSILLDKAAVHAARAIKCAPFSAPNTGGAEPVYFLKPFVFERVK
ncbi:energy transducer TonB [Ralstonia solanacearum species complex bacterium KE056]|uniref:energy transducer TonB n=1 Tax=Ralstonia solanacearum species complex bacterium KE056 TaxID=3119585 RepID=UPI003C6E0F6E